MSSPDLFSLFAAPLNRLDIPYMATGAVAAIAYSTPRLTNDIDLVVQLRASDARRLIAAFNSSQFYVPPLEVIAEEIGRP